MRIDDFIRRRSFLQLRNPRDRQIKRHRWFFVLCALGLAVNAHAASRYHLTYIAWGNIASGGWYDSLQAADMAGRARSGAGYTWIGPYHIYTVTSPPTALTIHVAAYSNWGDTIAGWEGTNLFYISETVCKSDAVWNDVEHACVAAPQQQCHIGLSGFPAEVEPGGSVRNLRADVTCDGVPTPKEVTLQSKVTAYSGGHQHDDTIRHARHAGAVPATVASGTSFTFTAPASAGDHTVTAKCADGSCGEDTDKIWVGVKGLIPIPPIPDLLPQATYQLYESNGQPIGRTDFHPENHYLTLDAVIKLWNLGFRYSAIEFPNYPLLHVNDASLVRGGLFDLDANWRPKHHEHRRGTVVDVRANGATGSIPMKPAVFESFEEIAQRLGIDADLHGSGANQHYHLRLRGVKE